MIQRAVKKTLVFICAAAIATSLSGRTMAASFTWNQGTANTYSWDTGGNWAGGTPADTAGNTADFNSVDLTGDVTVNLTTTGRTLGSLIFGDTNTATAGGWTIAGPNTLTLDNTGGTGAPAIQVNSLGSGKVVSITAPLAGTAGFIKNGLGGLSLSNANGLNGGVTINQGALTLDFTPGTLTNDVINSGNTLNIKGGASAATNSQTLTGLTLGLGSNTLNIDSGTGTMNVALGTLARATTAVGSTLQINGPAVGTLTAAPGAGVTYRAILNNITGGTAPAAGSALIGGTGSGVNKATFATYGLSDYAATTATSGTATVVPGSAIANFYSTVNPQSNSNTSTMWDLQASFTTTTSTLAVFAMRFNNPAATSFTIRDNFGAGGILITPNMGTNNVTFSNGAGAVGVEGSRDGTNSELVIWQNNTAAELIMNATIADKAGGQVTIITQAGPGTVFYSGVNTNNGQFYLNSGYSVIQADSGLGAAAGGQAVNLSGGTLVGNANFALDNGNGNGTNARPVTVAANFTNTLAATTGNTMTVTGVISDRGTFGPGSLTIGTGTLAGTGGGTANATAINGDGTVSLTATNTYSGNTTVTAGATLRINGINAIGSTSSLTLNNGKLQYNATSANGSTDISTKPITFASGGATIDTNGNNVTWANSVGGGGSATLTINDTAATPGKLTFGGNNSYSGGTTISRGTLLANNSTGTATGSGNVTVNSGGFLGGTGSVAGVVSLGTGNGSAGSGGALAPGAATAVGTLTLGGLTFGADSFLNYQFSSSSSYSKTVVTGNNGLSIDGTSNAAFNLFLAGGVTPWSTPGTYKLIQYAGTLQGNALDSTWTTAAGGNVHVLDRIGGLTYQFSTTNDAGFLDLIIAGTGPASWNFNGDQSWNTPGNWSTNSVPNGVGATANLSVGTTVTVNVPTLNVTVGPSVTVGTISFGNPTTSYNVQGSAITIDNGLNGNAQLIDTAGTHQISAPLNLNSITDIKIATGAGPLTLSGAISGSTAININPTAGFTGTVAISGNNTGYSGNVTLSAGTLQLGNSNAFGTGGLTVNKNGTTIQAGASVSPNNAITLDNTGGNITANIDTNGNTLTLGGAIGETNGSGSSVNILGGGTLALTGNSTYAGSTTVGASTTLQLGNNTATGSVPGTSGITNSGALVLKRSDTALDMPMIISGSGTLTNSGTGTTQLSAANTFGGNTTISGGTLVLNNSLALQNSTLQYNNQGGTIAFTTAVAGTVTLGGLNGAQNLSLVDQATGAIALTVGGNGQSTEFDGTLTGGTNLIKNGGGTLTLGNQGTWTGTATVNGGILALNSTGSMTSTTLTIVTGAGGVQNNGGAIVATGGASSFQSGGGGYFQNGGSAQFGDIAYGSNSNTGNTLNISGGTFTAGNLNSNRSALSITNNPAASGSTTDGIYISGTPTVHFTGAVNLGNNANSSVSMRMDGGTVTIDGAVTIGQASGNRWSVLDVNGATFTNNDAVTGIQICDAAGYGEFLVRAGTASVQRIQFGTADNSQIGYLNVSGGTLYVGSGGIVRGAAGGTTFDCVVNFGTATIGASADWATDPDINAPTVHNTTGDTFVPTAIPGITLNGTTTFQAADSLNVSHNITINSPLVGGGALIKTGGGTLTLAGNNTYSGGTTVNTGKVLVAHVNGLGTGGLTINSAATTQLQAGLTAPVQLPSLSIAGDATPTGTLDVSDNNMVIHNGNITTSLAQLKSGLNASGTLWTGTGVRSSTAAADAAAHSNSTVFAVGAIQNVDKLGNAIYTTWPAPPSPDTGATGLTSTDVLVKYTYFGDANLDGVVDNTSDYDLWSTGFTDPGLAATNGWLYGDFDFSGIVDNTTDYDLWSTGFTHQGGPLSGNADPGVAVTPVPEPGAIVLAVAGMVGMLVVAPRAARKYTPSVRRNQLRGWGSFGLTELLIGRGRAE
jgi:fibronectin-binding autotransporter adhesin